MSKLKITEKKVRKVGSRIFTKNDEVVGKVFIHDWTSSDMNNPNHILISKEEAENHAALY